MLALGSLIKRLYETKTAQSRLEEAVKSGSVEIIKSAIAIEEETLSVERNKAAKMSLLGINAKLLQSQQRLTKLRAALVEAESKKPQPKPTPTPEPTPLATLLKPDGKLESKAKGKTDLEKQQEAAAELLKNLKERTTLAEAMTSDEYKSI